MAEAFGRMLGGPDVEFYSAGSHPSGRINRTAIEAMAELGYDLRNHRSTSIDDLPDVCFDAAVGMGCGEACPNVRARRRVDWNVIDPRSLPLSEFREVRDEIEAKVRALLSEDRSESAG
jgi:protein-tyrosine-phosphatase